MATRAVPSPSRPTAPGAFDPGDAYNTLRAGETRTTSVTYTVSDSRDTDTATLTVTVTGVNDPPTMVKNQVGAASHNQILRVAADAEASRLIVTDAAARQKPPPSPTTTASPAPCP